MELSLMASSSSPTRLLPLAQSLHLLQREIHVPIWSKPFSSLKVHLSERSRRSLVVAGAKNKKKNKSSEKVDDHSFVSRPDEATGPFPEAVLLKKKVVKEDGRVLPEFADAEEEELYEFLKLQLESDLNLERMRHYEMVYLIHEDNIEEVPSVISKVEEFIREKKGRIWRLNNWGLRRLAYKIRKANKANYVLMNFELEAKHINEFKSMLDKDERIIRHLVMKQDEAITEDCPPPPEFHTLRGGMDEEDDDIDDEDDWEDDDGLEDYDDDKENIIIVDDDDDDDQGGQNRSMKTLEAKKMAL
ncbi:30S ribosomal protein S6 [Dioscorea cayenensis subsp. rotundata]|uniref:30S ribosomal protein S6 n=1 Tax=Dioscorea cayennensis subsp. rotundata TaxID=55577 RepID=A0AB40BKL4_DIOCR|nr:30S ribosomal protein S6 [Dioscorea cayenensis subsp. rotundata]